MIEELSDCEVYEAKELVNDLENEAWEAAYQAWEAENEAKIAKQMQEDEDRFYENGQVWDSLGYEYD